MTNRPTRPASGNRRVIATHPATDDRQKVWASMRVLPHFTIKDLALVTEAPVDSVRPYVNHLARFGYVRHLSTRARGEKVWRLVRNTGPQAPRFGPSGLTDLNTGKAFDRSGHEVPLVTAAVYKGRGGRALARAHGRPRT